MQNEDLIKGQNNSNSEARMSKLFAHMFLSLLISLGLIAGIPNVRKEVTHILNETKATAQQAVDTAVQTARDMTSQINPKLNVNASSNTTVKADSKMQTKTDAKTKVDSSTKLSLGDSSVKVIGNAQTNLNLDLNSGK
jgi:hypothetical protein